MGKRKTILLVIASIVVLGVIGGLLALWNPVPPRVVAIPFPNGYDAFVQAGALVQEQTWDFAKMNDVELGSIVDANSNALQVARSGLAEKSRVPLGFTDQYITNRATDLAQIKRLAAAFLAEGRLAELEQRTNDAAQAYLDAARLGISSRQGGIEIDGLVGIAEETMGTSQLQKVAPNLDAHTSAAVARQLEIADSNQESWEQIRQNEKNWSRRAYPGLQRRIIEIFVPGEMKATRTKSKQRFDTQENRTRRLILDLAAHAYELDNGHRPTNAADLVPAYLMTAPIDPLTGKEMTLTP